VPALKINSAQKLRPMSEAFEMFWKPGDWVSTPVGTGQILSRTDYDVRCRLYRVKLAFREGFLLVGAEELKPVTAAVASGTEMS